ncbi:BTB/POZ domain-containing protein 6-B-like isoform X2 [Dreissena polymorpha]|nr:BTB/POZ domain-containing protein 6-B-like isoform X2 [Dreissena polymorpha]
MFCGPLAESSGIVSIPDIESPTMDIFLRYMYSGKVNIDEATVLEMMYVSRKYDVSRLESQCNTFLNEIMCADNACTILDQAIIYDNFELKSKCLAIIITETESVLVSDAFKQISKAGLEELLKCDKLSACEPDLYIACKKWATLKCQDAGIEETDEAIRNELGEELIRLIRFPSMTPEQFTDIVATSTVLSKDEMLMVYRSIIKHDNVSTFKSDNRYVNFEKHPFVMFDNTLKYNGLIDKIYFFKVTKYCAISRVAISMPCTVGSVNGTLEIMVNGLVVNEQEVSLNYMKGKKH